MQKAHYKKAYDKLVRDRIPEIIQQDGFTSRIEILDEQAFQQALKEKLLEEAQEVVEAEPGNVIKELADLYEVLDTFIQQQHITQDEVRACQAVRRQERGGFTQRIRLLEIL